MEGRADNQGNPAGCRGGGRMDVHTEEGSDLLYGVSGDQASLLSTAQLHKHLSVFSLTDTDLKGSDKIISRNGKFKKLSLHLKKELILKNIRKKRFLAKKEDILNCKV